jgi:predicted RNA-binding protein with PIN domain
MRYLIDGYNLLFKKQRYIEDFSQDRASLIEELSRITLLLHMDVRIVFDAHCRIDEGSFNHKQCLGIVYTDFGQTADDYIVRLVSCDPYPASICVVTSDNRLALRCRRNFSQTMQVPKFLHMLAEKRRKKQARLKSEMEEKPSFLEENREMTRWLKIFTERAEKGDGA